MHIPSLQTTQRDLNSFLRRNRVIAILLTILYGAFFYSLGTLHCRYLQNSAILSSRLSENNGCTKNNSTVVATTTTTEEDVVPKRVVMTTLADADYLGCALRLVKQIREHDWDDDIIVLTIGKGNQSELNALSQFGAKVVETTGVLDEFVPKRLHANKFRKMEIFLNETFREYDTLVYMDADGLVRSSLLPYMRVGFPEGKSVLMQENSYNTGKGALYETTLLKDLRSFFKDERDLRDFKMRYPDRHGNGASAWFVVDMNHVYSAEMFLKKTRGLLTKFHQVFAFNDQTLMNLLFYHDVAFFSTCSKYEIKVIERADKFHPYCVRTKKQLKDGEENTFLYRHGDKECVRGHHSRFF